jgi:hypothetical protein
MLLTRRSATIALVLFISAGDVGLCAGWAATAEARMACCVGGGSCPMHKSDEDGSDSARAVSQAEADGCCAASESDDLTPSTPTFAMAVPPAALVHQFLAFVPPSALPLDAARESVPLACSQVPKHLLLSVFLI